MHEALLWMGYVTDDEARPWQRLARRARRRAAASCCEGGRWFAVEATREPKEVLRGRLEALGPVFVDPGSDDEAAADRSCETRRGRACARRMEGRTAWCDRRLLARIHRYTLDRLRREIEPVTRRATSCASSPAGSTSTADDRLEGPRGVREVVQQLAGFEAARGRLGGERPRPRACAATGASGSTSSRSRGEVAWGRLWGAGPASVRRTPITLVPRDELDAWPALAAPIERPELGSVARQVQEIAARRRGAVFLQELARARAPAHGLGGGGARVRWSRRDA